jgi:hypothetical protein
MSSAEAPQTKRRRKKTGTLIFSTESSFSGQNHRSVCSACTKGKWINRDFQCGENRPQRIHRQHAPHSRSCFSRPFWLQSPSTRSCWKVQRGRRSTRWGHQDLCRRAWLRMRARCCGKEWGSEPQHFSQRVQSDLESACRASDVVKAFMVASRGFRQQVALDLVRCDCKLFSISTASET